MANEIVEAENPLRKFDADVLKSIGSTSVDGTTPRSTFLPGDMGEAMELAKLMAASNFVPPHMRSKAGDCLAIVMQATRWGMDPFAVGNKTFFVNDRMAFESQLVNAVVNSSNALNGRLKVSWEGDGNDLVCVVSGFVKGDPDIKTRRVPIKNITTRNSPLWKQDPEQQLAYYATRAWARLYTPEVLMGVYTPDEVQEMPPVDGGRLTATATRPALTSAMLASQANGEAADKDYVAASSYGRINGIVDDEPETGRSDEQHGDQHDGTDGNPAERKAADLISLTVSAENMDELALVQAEADKHLPALPDELAARLTAALDAAEARILRNQGD
ncbi:recombinase RecT [Sphingobium fluviale]|uniref:recombinase RecT n=1 Tax=Sphingobium fluviale TaxID=2506423 RepID=UPI0013E998F9|nr:recombinase RecT [Sphingobium fluviale]